MSGSDAVDDCVQEAMVVVLNKFNQVKALKSFHAWVYQVINSKCMDYWRKQHHHLSMDDVISETGIADKRSLIQNDRELDVRLAMGGLSKIQHAVIYLFYYEGFRVTEVASILDKPAGTIKSILFDARQEIKMQLNQENYNEYR